MENSELQEIGPPKEDNNFDKAKTGRILLTIGVIIGVIAFFMNVGVNTEFGAVANLDLMSQRTGVMILAGILCIMGTILIAAPKENTLIADQIIEQNRISLAQLSLLAGMADKLGMPVNDINEVVNGFSIEYE